MTAGVERLEMDGYSPFTELSMDDGVWEVEVYKDDVPYELTVDPDSGKILSEHRDDSEPRPLQDAKPLSEILQLLAKAGTTTSTTLRSNAGIGSSRSIAKMARMRVTLIRPPERWCLIGLMIETTSCHVEKAGGAPLRGVACLF